MVVHENNGWVWLHIAIMRGTISQLQGIKGPFPSHLYQGQFV